MLFTIRRAAAIFSVASLGLLGACRSPAAALGDTPEQARSNAHALFGALSARFGPSAPAAGYADVRAKFARSALVPSRIYDDRQLWTASEQDARVLELSGRPAGGRYVLGVRGADGPPRATGHYRRINRLRQLGRDEYEWRIRDELAVGTVTPDQMGAALSALLSAAEETNGATARAAAHSLLPRTSSALGRLFSLDTIAMSAAPGGGSFVTLVTTMRMDRLAPDFPHLARYLERYASPARFDFTVHDEHGMRWWVAAKDGDQMTLRLKVHDGNIAPLDGPPRRMPDRMRVRGSMATRIRIFNIGMSDLRGQVALTRSSGEKSFTVRFDREPEWHLPLLVERMLRTPLRRPFEGDGTSTTFAVRRGAGSTLLLREYDIAVQESAIIRWFGGLGSTAMGDFRRGAEQEYDRFLGELFTALQRDAVALIQ